MAKSEKLAKLEAFTVVEVAELLSVTEKSVRNWMNQKGLPFKDGQRGRVLHWPTVLEWYVSFRADEGGSNGKKASAVANDVNLTPEETYEQALKRKVTAEADRLELKLAQERGQVVAVQDVEKSIAKVSTSLKSAILGLPAKLSTRLYGVRDRNQLRAILDAEARELCIKLATIGQESAPDVAEVEDEPDAV